jgi:hypothetical protein
VSARCLTGVHRSEFVRNPAFRHDFARPICAELKKLLDFLVARELADALFRAMRRNLPTLAKKTTVTIAAAALLMLSACSGSGQTSQPAAATSLLPHTSTGMTTTTAATTATDTERDVVAAEQAFWNLYLQLGARTGRFNPADTRALLARRTAGGEFTKLYDVLVGNAAAGYVVRGTISVAPTVVSVTATTARVRDCYADRTGLFRRSDGRRLDANDPRRHKVLVTLVRAGGAWKVSAVKGEGLGCVA